MQTIRASSRSDDARVWSGLNNPFSLSHLRRQTSGRAYVPEIDGLRFVAILSVVLFHIAIQIQTQPHGQVIASMLDPLVHNGYRGVQLFFVISGFILGLPFARHRLTGAPMMPLRDYFLRRVTRLEPPYVVIMLLRAALLLLVMGVPFAQLWPHLLASLGYIHGLVYGYPSIINTPVWSLEVEIQFYCLAPFLACVLFSLRSSTLLRRILFAILIVGSGLVQHYYITHQDRVWLSIAYSIQYFLAGFLLCDLYVLDWQKIPSHWLWDLISLPLWLWVFWSDSIWYHVWLPVACLVLYVAAFKGPMFRGVFRHPAIAIPGGMCYSIYLTHNLVLSFAGRIFGSVAASSSPSILLVGALTVLMAALAFAGGLIYYLLIERPCMDRDWPQKLASRLHFRRSQVTS